MLNNTNRVDRLWFVKYNVSRLNYTKNDLGERSVDL